MSDTVLALIVTALILLVLAAWAPVLHAAEAVAMRYARRATHRRQQGTQEDSGTEQASVAA